MKYKNDLFLEMTDLNLEHSSDGLNIFRRNSQHVKYITFLHAISYLRLYRS